MDVTTVYRSSGWGRSSIGEVKGDTIYSTGGFWNSQIGEVRNGRVFKVSGAVSIAGVGGRKARLVSTKPAPSIRQMDGGVPLSASMTVRTAAPPPPCSYFFCELYITQAGGDFSPLAFVISIITCKQETFTIHL